MQAFRRRFDHDPASPIPLDLRRMRRSALSVREREVMAWVALGKTNREIAVILDLSPRTVAKHLEHVYKKLCVETRTAAAVCWIVEREKEAKRLL